jgi:thiamine biosynthesis lipoprotein
MTLTTPRTTGPTTGLTIGPTTPPTIGPITRRRALTILAAAAPALAFAPGAPVTRWRGRALGAEASITLAGTGAGPALDAARDAIRRAEAAFSLFDPASALSRLNAGGSLLRPPPEMLALAAEVSRLHALSDGAFDPTVQPLWRLLAQTRGRADAAQIAEARALIGWDGVRVDAAEIAFDRPGMALTFNGIAQGFATDRAAAALAAHGFAAALVDVGEWRAMDGTWRIARGDGGEVLTLSRRAMATSEPGAMRLGASGHILSPGGAAQGFSRVTILAPTAALADGLSTALCAAGPGRARAIMARAPLASMIAETADGARIEIG